MTPFFLPYNQYMAAYKKKGFSIGIFIFLVMQFTAAPVGLSDVGWDVAAVAVLMAIWWATETLSLIHI